MLVLGAFGVVVVAGCAGKRIEHGVFHSPKGYQVAVPGDGWTVIRDSRADLELRRDDRLGMLVNAACAAESSRSTLPVLERHLLSGLRERALVMAEDVVLAGRPARHAVVDGRSQDARGPVRVELYVMRDGSCVYDLLYAAPPDAYEGGRPDFERFVKTFRVE